jgi:hypothetical protein
MKDKEFGKLTEWLRKEMIKSFFNKGYLTKDDLNLDSNDLNKKFISLVQKGDWRFIPDHRDDIITHANNFLKSKSYNYAKVFYAMYFEHSLNAIIKDECEKLGIDEKVQTEIIRSTDIHAKLTWLPKLLKIRGISSKHVKIIKKLTDDRNSFVHYKWKIEDDPLTPKNENEKIGLEFDQIKDTIKYLKQYNSSIKYGGNKRTIEKKLKAK